MSDSERMIKGRAMATKLLEGTKRADVPLSPRLLNYTLEHLFGDVWQGDDLALEERSLITCTALVAMNRTAEQYLHFVAAKNVGVPREKLEAMLAHVAHYAGWPCSVSANHVLNEVWPVPSAE